MLGCLLAPGQLIMNHEQRKEAICYRWHMKQVLKQSHNYIKALVMPISVLIILLIMMGIKDIQFIETPGHLESLLKAITAVFLTTLALSVNLNSGRFDFSVGAVALLSSVIASRIAITYAYSVWQMIAMSLVAGLCLGVIAGLVYIIVKLPPIITSLGITLMFEGAAFHITEGYGVSFVSNAELTSFGSVRNYVIITLVILFLVLFIFEMTKYGYDYKALLSGQKVGVSVGIKEKTNAVISYAISGALMGIVGAINASNTGTIQMSLSFGSIAIMFTAFLPMFIGSFLSRYCNLRVGYLIGAITVSMISLAYARLDVSSSVQQITTALILVGFLIYLNNEGAIKNLFKQKKRHVRGA